MVQAENPNEGLRPGFKAMGLIEYEDLPATAENMPDDMVKMLAYWQEVRGDRIAPRWEDFKLFNLPADIIPMTVVVDVSDTGDAFTYRFWGSGRTTLHGRDNTGREVRNSLPDAAGPTVVEQYQQVLAARRPTLFRNIYPLQPRARSVCVTLRLPLSTDGERIDKICAALLVVENPDLFADFLNPSNEKS